MPFRIVRLIGVLITQLLPHWRLRMNLCRLRHH
jgi:hypothetical protein